MVWLERKIKDLKADQKPSSSPLEKCFLPLYCHLVVDYSTKFDRLSFLFLSELFL
jgi:hypothetical protein